jgi:ribonucleoside-diphosphate reductase alpha chain
LPSDATIEDVGKIYEEAWKAGLKGITVYRKGCRDGVILEKPIDKDKNSDIIKEEIKRPKYLPCNVHHTIIAGCPYIILVGMLNNKPYEVFSAKNEGEDGGIIVPKSTEEGIIVKKKKNFYVAIFNSTNNEISPITDFAKEKEQIITRFISLTLRSGSDVLPIVKQLEKVGETKEMQCFSRGLVRALKKYIPDGTVEKEEVCPECGATNGVIVRQEGCVRCMGCGWSKCL